MVNAKKVLNFLFKFDNYSGFAVAVAQLVEHQVVALVAAGSNPVTHPIDFRAITANYKYLPCHFRHDPHQVEWGKGRVFALTTICNHN